MKIHTTFRKRPDDSVELIEMSLCRDDDPDFMIEEPDGSTLYRVSGTLANTEANSGEHQRPDEA